MVYTIKSLNEFEEQCKRLLEEFFTELIGQVFVKLDEAIKEKKQAEGWAYSRSDKRNIQFLFGNVHFKRSLMHDKNENPIILWMNGWGLNLNSDIVPLSN